MDSVAWMENWTHVGCGWRVFLQFPEGETLLVVQGVNVLAGTLVMLELDRAREKLFVAAYRMRAISALVQETLAGADGAAHRGLLETIAEKDSGLADALEAKAMLASMERNL